MWNRFYAGWNDEAWHVDGVNGINGVDGKDGENKKVSHRVYIEKLY